MMCIPKSLLEVSDLMSRLDSVDSAAIWWGNVTYLIECKEDELFDPTLWILYVHTEYKYYPYRHASLS